MSISNGLALPNTFVNGQVTDAPSMMANLGVLLVALNRSLLDAGNGLGMNAQASQIHNLLDPTSAQDAATQNYVLTQLASYPTNTSLATTLALYSTTALANAAVATTLAAALVPYALTAGVPVNGFSALTISTLGASNYTSVIGAGSVILHGAAGTFLATSVNVSPVLSASGANGIDTGASAASTWYYLHVIYNPTTKATAGLFSLSASAPTLPSGYAYSARVGAVRTLPSGYLMPTLQIGRRVQYVVSAALAGMPIIANGAVGSVSVPTWVAYSVSTFVPPTASTVLMSIGSSGESGSYWVIAAPNNSYGPLNSTTNPPPFSGYSTANSNPYSTPVAFLLESSSIYYASSDYDGRASVSGWEDNL